MGQAGDQTHRQLVPLSGGFQLSLVVFWTRPVFRCSGRWGAAAMFCLVPVTEGFLPGGLPWGSWLVPSSSRQWLVLGHHLAS